MAVLFLSALTLVAIAIIVWLLHRQQKRATSEYAERHQPLPPLETPELEPGADPVDSDEDVVAGPDASGTDELPGDWLRQCQQLRQAGQLEEAADLAERALPRLQAFEQQALIRRAQLREARRANDEERQRACLDALYRTAARASLLHDAPHPGSDASTTPRRLADHLTTDQWQAIELPYQQIGHRQLRLLRKTDQQLLEAFHGHPERHTTARQWFGS